MKCVADYTEAPVDAAKLTHRTRNLSHTGHSEGPCVRGQIPGEDAA